MCFRLSNLKMKGWRPLTKFDELYPSRKYYTCFDSRNAVFARAGFRGYSDRERVEEMIYAPAALNLTRSIARKNNILKIVATQMIPSSGKVNILCFNALKDRAEIMCVD